MLDRGERGEEVIQPDLNRQESVQVTCSRCPLPENFPGAHLDQEGVCSYCREYKPFQALGEEKFREIIFNKRGEKYDCVIPISGGKDSTYILYYCVKILGLRAVAAHFDSGFIAEIAQENLRRTCEILNVPLVIIRAEKNTQYKMLREILEVSEALGMFYHICGNCEVLIRTVAINTAIKYQTPFVIYGSSSIEDNVKAPFKGRVGFFHCLKNRWREFPKIVFHLAKYCFLSVRQRIQMQVPGPQRYRPFVQIPFPKNTPIFLHFFQYIKWDTMNKVELLQRELNWSYPAERKSRFDCLVHCFGNFKDFFSTGVTADGFIMSSMVRDNRMNKEEFFTAERELVESLEEECQYIVKKVGLNNYKMPRIKYTSIK